jgi:hypothetical protein
MFKVDWVTGTSRSLHSGWTTVLHSCPSPHASKPSSFKSPALSYRLLNSETKHQAYVYCRMIIYISFVGLSCSTPAASKNPEGIMIRKKGMSYDLDHLKAQPNSFNRDTFPISPSQTPESRFQLTDVYTRFFVVNFLGSSYLIFVNWSVSSLN